MDGIKAINHLRQFCSSARMLLGKRSLPTLGELCEILAAPVPAGLDPSRRIALVNSFDGAFVRDCLYVHYEEDAQTLARTAMRRGACAVLSSAPIGDIPCIVAPDVRRAVISLLSPSWEKRAIPAVAVTGSVGKTTTKNLIDCVLSTRYRTFCNPTNGNTFGYLGYELQRFDRKAQAFVQEVNESDPHNCAACSRLLRPHIAAVTNIDISHIGELGSEENIKKAICEITAGMKDDDVVILNRDDRNSKDLCLRQRMICVGIEDRQADCTAENIDCQAEKTTFDLLYQGVRTRIQLQLPGRQNIYNAMMAFVAGRLLGIAPSDIAKGLARFRAQGFRQNICRAGRRTLYIDCYNASAKSVSFSLDSLSRIPCAPDSKRIAVLGDIAEVGDYADATYTQIAAAVLASGVDALITYGEGAAEILRHIPPDAALACWSETTFGGLLSRVRSVSRGRDALLFKASRSMALEKAVRALYPAAYVKSMLPVWITYLRWTVKTL